MTCDAGVVVNLKTKGLSGQLYCDVILVTSVDMNGRFILSSVALVLCVDVLHSLPHTYLQVTRHFVFIMRYFRPESRDPVSQTGCSGLCSCKARF